MLTMIFMGSLASKRASMYSNIDVTFYTWEVILSLILFSIVFGMRFGVGVDHLSYLNTYMTGENVERYEWAFRQITLLFTNHKLHYTIYFSILAFIQVFFFFLAFKDERFLFPALTFILFTGGYFLAWMNGIRQDIAACIFIYSIKYISRKDIGRYILWCSLAILFHKSAVLLILFYPLFVSGKDYLKNSTLQFFLLMIALSIYYSGFKIEEYFGTQIIFIADQLNYQGYLEEGFNHKAAETFTGIGFILILVVDIIIIFFNSKLKEYFNSKRFIIIYNLYFLGIITRISFSGSLLLLRPFRYLSYFKLIIVSYLLYYLFKNAKNSYYQIFFLLIILIYIGIFSAMIYRGDINTAKFLFFWQV